MALVCPQCGADRRSVEQRFCESCGARFSVSAASERRQVPPRQVPPRHESPEPFDPGIGWPGDLDAIAERVVQGVEERGEHAHVLRSGESIGLMDRTGTTVVTPVGMPGEAALSEDYATLFLDGRPVELPLKTRGYRHVVCLVRAALSSRRDEDGRMMLAHYNVAPWNHLPGVLRLPKTPEHLVERTDEELVAAVRDTERPPQVVRVHAREPRAAAADVAASAPAASAPATAPAAVPTAAPAGRERDGGLREALAELDALIGLREVKEEVRKLTGLVRIRKLREERGMPVSEMGFHAVFAGNPGTGKTTVARLLAKVYGATGLLPEGHLVEVGRSDLVGAVIGETERKTRQKIEEALGGVLFIDEAYALVGGGDNDFGRKAIDELVAQMENRRGEFVVVAAGYSREMDGFMEANPGLESRFSRTITFPDYSPEEMFEIFEGMCARDDYVLSEGARTTARAHLGRLHSARAENFGNARDVRKVFADAVAAQMSRLAALEEIGDEDLTTIEAADLPASGGDEERKRAALAELEGLVGLGGVKRQVADLANLARFNAARVRRGRAASEPNLHMVFTGNPGTGKTTVARLIGEIYASLGLLSRGHVEEVSRGDLVGAYQGHTARSVQAAFRRAAGGVLFIDEAYALVQGGNDGFGQEALNALLTEMENRRADLVVVAAGYPRDMQGFVEANPGLKRRFPTTIHFPDYSPEDLLEIFEGMCEKGGYRLEDAARLTARRLVQQMHAGRDEHFGNAGEVRTLYERTTNNLANRLASVEDPTDEMLSIISAVEMPCEDEPLA